MSRQEKELTSLEIRAVFKRKPYLSKVEDTGYIINPKKNEQTFSGISRSSLICTAIE
jgi:hypothetical protein